MGLRFRKSIKITKGIRLNLNKNSNSVTFGRGSVKHTINSNGKVTRTIGIPKTGVYYTETLNNSKGDKHNKSLQQSDKTYSPKVYKFASISALFFGILLLLLCIVLLFVSPLIAIFGIGISTAIIRFAYIFLKKSKRAKEHI